MINIYNMGIVHCSVCTPKEMTREEVVAAVNNNAPTGLSHGWLIDSKKFASGQENPCICEHNVDRLHYLMVC